MDRYYGVAGRKQNSTTLAYKVTELVNEDFISKYDKYNYIQLYTIIYTRI